MKNVFEERVTSEKGDEIVWYTEQSSDGDHVKIREHLVDYVPVKADASFCRDETKDRPDKMEQATQKIKFISKPKPPKQEEQKSVDVHKKSVKIVEMPKTETVVQGKEVIVTEEKQLQKEISGDTEITRKVKETKTMEQEHKLATTERKVFGVKPETIAPRFTKKIQPCRANERREARFECEFYGKPQPKVTWYRENFEIQSSEDFKVNVGISLKQKIINLIIRSLLLKQGLY